MLVSYRWLKELLPSLEAPPLAVAEKLSAAGLAVDAVREIGAGLEALVLAQVKKIEPHPKRSGLSLVTVDRGGAEQCVVCGANNVPAPGGFVLLAPLGAKLPGLDAPLAARDIGGVRSEGMLCSEQELGLADSSSGIFIPEPDAGKPGTSFLTAYPEARDTIFELDVTPNRPDALGHVGVARELAALFGLSFELPEPGSPKRVAEARIESLITIENRDLERCPHYAAGAVLDVTVGPSPHWLRWRLASLGVRPISNVVDVTNLLLFEFGQPLHAFDLDRVRGQRIIVRRATQGEPFTTLDGVARILDADDLVIADAEGPSALAGVMGGQDSEIRPETRRVLIECAYFTPRGVRRSSRRHGLHSESSHRFERGVDFAAVPRVLERAKVLLTELAGGAAVPGATHARAEESPLPRITLRSSRLNALLGSDVPFGEATGILERLGFEVEKVSGSGETAVAEVRAVSFRPDVRREVDLIEEVSRVRGLDAIPTRLPAVLPQPPRRTGKIEREASAEAVALGLSEALTYAFVSPKELAAVHAPPSPVTLSNPLSEERSVMRTSLLPGLLDAVRRARRRGESRARLFSVGACFGPPVAATSEGARPRLAEDVGTLPEERPMLAAVLAGPRHEYLTLKPENVDVYDMKGIALELVERLTGRNATVTFTGASERTRHLHPRGAAEIGVEGTPVGVFGPLHPDVVDAFDLETGLQVCEIDLSALEALGKRTPKYRPIPKLPAVTRDLSLVVSESVAAGQAQSILAAAGGELCESVELVGLFRGGSVPAGGKSLTFRVVCRDPKARIGAEDARTLTDKEVDAVQQRMIEAVTRELGATLRA